MHPHYPKTYFIIHFPMNTCRFNNSVQEDRWKGQTGGMHLLPIHITRTERTHNTYRTSYGM